MPLFTPTEYTQASEVHSAFTSLFSLYVEHKTGDVSQVLATEPGLREKMFKLFAPRSKPPISVIRTPPTWVMQFKKINNTDVSTPEDTPTNLSSLLKRRKSTPQPSAARARSESDNTDTHVDGEKIITITSS